MLVGDGDRLLGLPVSKIGLSGPPAPLDHRLEDHVGDERPLLGRVAVGNLYLLHREVGGQANHATPGWIEVDRLSARVRDADEIRRVLEQRHEDLPLVLDALAIADVAHERLPAAVRQYLGVQLDRELRPVLSQQPPLGYFGLAREEALLGRGQPTDVFGGDQIDDRLPDDLLPRVSEHLASRAIDVGVAALEVRDEDPVRRVLDQLARLRAARRERCRARD